MTGLSPSEPEANVAVSVYPPWSVKFTSLKAIKIKNKKTKVISVITVFDSNSIVLKFLHKIHYTYIVLDSWVKVSFFF